MSENNSSDFDKFMDDILIKEKRQEKKDIEPTDGQKIERRYRENHANRTRFNK